MAANKVTAVRFGLGKNHSWELRELPGTLGGSFSCDNQR